MKPTSGSTMRPRSSRRPPCLLARASETGPLQMRRLKMAFGAVLYTGLLLSLTQTAGDTIPPRLLGVKFLTAGPFDSRKVRSHLAPCRYLLSERTQSQLRATAALHPVTGMPTTT
jgi:hypothetical protein